MKRDFLFGFCLIATLLLRCGQKSSEVKTPSQASEQNTNDLPTMTVTKIDGSRIQINSLTGNTVLVLFQSDCDHCQREAKKIREHISSFTNYSIFFISADPLPTIEKFAADYNLLGQTNIYFGSTTVESVLSNFGPIPTPSVYIYSNQRLAKKFNGEAPIEKILEAI